MQKLHQRALVAGSKLWVLRAQVIEFATER